jgi:predicted O-methyltransferase YrrM
LGYAATIRRIARTAHQDAKFAYELRGLPARVAAMQLRSRARARRIGDTFSPSSATRPADLGLLLGLARGRRFIVELGTGTAWTAIAFALADPLREVMSFDVGAFPEREEYLSLLDLATRKRIELIVAPGASGAERPSRPVELLYIDSSHEREQTIAEVRAWKPMLAPDALIVFDDYENEQWPGVRQAIEELGLTGKHRGTLFVHQT